jgi:hypothetical protein
LTAAFYYAAALLAGDLGKFGVRPDAEDVSSEARGLWRSFLKRGVAETPSSAGFPDGNIHAARMPVTNVRRALVELGWAP